MIRNHVHVEKSVTLCPYVLPLIVYVHARQRNCWLFTTRKPKVVHLSRQTFRHNKALSTNALHLTRQLLIRHELSRNVNASIRALNSSPALDGRRPMRMKRGEVKKCRSEHKQRKQKNEKFFRRTKQQKSCGTVTYS